MKNNDKKKAFISLAAINQVVESNIIEPTEKEVRGQSFVEWGANNIYPNYLYDLYLQSPTLHSIINGVIDYVDGNGAISNTLVINQTDVDDIVRDLAMSYAIYGGFAINVLRNKFGNICKLVVLDFKQVRSNKDNSLLYYSEDFGTKSYGRGKYLVYPAFDKNNTEQYSSIYYYKSTKHTTYPSQMYTASIHSAEIEKQIGKFHLNSIINGFSSNVIVSLNNGMPTPEVQSEIEDAFTEKFTGSENAGRPLIVFNNDKEHAVEILKVDTDSFADRYEALTEKVQQDLFTAFRANPNLFGIHTDGTGFSGEEYENTFKLFNRFVILPIQKTIVRVLNDICGEDSVSIQTFDINSKIEKI